MESPYATDLSLPTFQCATEFTAILKAALLEFSDGIEQPVDENAALILGSIFGGEYRHQLFLERIDAGDRRLMIEVIVKAVCLSVGEIVSVLLQQP